MKENTNNKEIGLSKSDKKALKKMAMSGLQELERLEVRYEQMEKGHQKVAVIEEYVALADKLESHKERLWGRWDLAWACVFGGDPARALPVCAELLAIIEQHPTLLRSNGLGGKNDMTLLVTMLMHSTSMSLPQIPKEQCFALLQEARKKVEQFNKGHRFWEGYACRYYAAIGDFAQLEKHLELFLDTKRDSVSDCQACEVSNAARYMMLLGQQERALETIGTLTKTCSEQPWLTISLIIRNALAQGNLEQAKEYGRKLLNHSIKSTADVQFAAALLHLEAVTQEGIWADTVLFERCMSWIVDLWDKDLQFDFYLGAWVFCNYLGKNQDTIALSLPSQFALYQKNGVYHCQQLQDWFYQKSKEIADAFDARNEYDGYTKELKKVAKSMELFLK